MVITAGIARATYTIHGRKVNFAIFIYLSQLLCLTADINDEFKSSPR